MGEAPRGSEGGDAVIPLTSDITSKQGKEIRSSIIPALATVPDR